MAQEIINTGATANDGTGDPLRTAFIKTDNNFDQIWAAGPVGSNVQISGNTITTTVVNTDLVLAPNGVANVRLNNNTVPNANNIWYLGSTTNRWRGVYVGAAGLDVTGNITAAYVTANNDLTVNGNLIVDGDVIQIGNIVTDAKTIQLANTAATDAQANGSGITVGANDDIATMLYNSTSDTWVMNIGANISGNVTAPYFIGNGSLLTGITGYGNANVAAYLPTYTGNIGADTVNVTGNILVAREIRLGTLPSGNLEIVDDTAFNGPGIKTPGGSGLDLLIEPSGNLLLSADGGAVIVEDQTISTSPNTGALLVYGGVGVNGNINAGGNITANYFIGDGSQLTGLPASYGNANVAAYLPTYTGDIAANNITVSRTIRVGTLPSGNLEIVDDTPGNGPAIKTPGGSGLDLLIEPSGNLLLSADGGLVIVEDQTPSFNPNTGALLVYGGIGVNGNVNVGENISAVGWTGNLIPSANATYSLGNATNYWSNLWVANNTIYIGGVPLGISAGNVLTVDGEPVLQNDSNSSITTTGNLAAGNILTDNYLYANGEPFVSASTGNLEITGTMIEFAAGATEELITISPDGFAGQAVLQLPNNATANVYDTILTNTGGNVKISAGNGVDVYDWLFDADGNLNLPEGATISNFVNQNITIGAAEINLDPAAFGASTILMLPVTRTIEDKGYNLEVLAGGVSGSGTEPGDLYLRGGVSFINGMDGGNAYITGGSGGMGAASGNVEIRTSTETENYAWLFDTTGSLTAPGDITTTGNISAGNIILTDSFTVPSNFEIAADSSVLVEFNDGASNTSAFFAQFDEIYLNVLADSASTDFRISSSNVTISDGSGGASELIVIGNVSTGNLVVSESLIGSDASPQPTISGFSTISATGNITGGNLITSGIIDLGSNASIYTNSGGGNNLYIDDDNEVWLSINDGTNSVSLDATGNLKVVIQEASGNSVNVNFSVLGNGVTQTNTSIETTGNITGANLIATGNVIGNVSGFAIGYRDIPQVSFTGNATIATTDAGKHFYSTQSTDYILTIANNASQGFAVGAAISVVNQGTGNITIAQGSGVSLYLAGNATSGNRTVSTFGMATIMKVATDTWFINGSGVA